jgi:hypothetical protein
VCPFVCLKSCVFNYKMMIQVNDVFVLIRGSSSMKPIDCMDVS